MLSASLRTRLFMLIILPLIGVASIAAVARYWFAQETASQLYDQTLSVVALAITRDVVLSGGDVLAEDLLERLTTAIGDPIFYRVSGPSGGFLTGYSEAPAGLDIETIETGRPVFYDSTYLGDRVRAVAIREFLSDRGISGWTTVQVWQTTGERRRLAQRLLMQSLAIMAIVIFSAALLVWFGIQKGLAPLRGLREAILARSPEDLQPIRRAVPREVKPLVDATNTLLGRLVAELKQRETFISNAAHQLRNPIAGIQAMAEAGETAQTERALRIRMRLVADAARDTGRLTNQLLSLERAIGKRSTSDSGISDLNDIVAAVLGSRAPSALRQGIEITLQDCPGGCPVRGDPVLIGEAIENLIDNGLKYGCGEKGHLMIALIKEDGKARVLVEDNGPGIPPGDREKVFERFCRVSDHTVAGAGLGLAIVKAIADQHGGSVNLLDRPLGTCFELVLPA